MCDSIGLEKQRGCFNEYGFSAVNMSEQEAVLQA